MLQIKEAVEQLCACVYAPEGTESLPLFEAPGRVLGADCAASFDQPPFARSPLDGYAVRGDDTTGANLENPVRLRVIGKVFAGENFEGVLHPGEAVRIMTGAPIPAGADTVIRQEDTDCGVQAVSLYSSVSPFQNYCPAGEDYKSGDILLERCTVLNAAALSLLAGAGFTQAPVFTRPCVAVISTGDEVLQSGETLRPGKIYDSNRFYVTARLTELGCAPAASIHVGDNAESLVAEIQRLSSTTQLIVTTGGVSVGEKDILHRTVELLDAELLFWRVSMKPGSPVMAAKLQNTLLICLSGNPYGAAVNFELLVRPVMAKLTGNPRWTVRCEQAVLTQAYPKGAKHPRFLRGIAVEGQVSLSSYSQNSGTMRALAESNCLVELPAGNAGTPAGEKVWVHYL